MKTQTFESNIKSMMKRLKELEEKLQDMRFRGPQKNIYVAQINNIEEIYDEENLERGGLVGEETFDKEFSTLNVDTCYTKVNISKAEHKKVPWFLDSGAFHHVLGDHDVFTSMRTSSGTRITTVGGQSHHITSVGNVAIKLPSGEIQMIEYVLYSPGIVKNLLSMGFLASRGMSLEFKVQSCTIKNPQGEILTTAIRESDSGLYQLRGERLMHCSETLLEQVSTVGSQSMVWHQRLGHIHHHGLQQILQHGTVVRLPKMIVTNTPCVICALGKQTRQKVPLSSGFYSTCTLTMSKQFCQM